MDRELQRKVVRGLAIVAAVVAILLVLMFVRSGRASTRPIAVAAAREPVAAAPKPALAEPQAPAPTPAPRATPAPAATRIPATPEPTPAPEETLTVEQSAIGPLWLVGTVRDEAGAAVEGVTVILARQQWDPSTRFGGIGAPMITEAPLIAEMATDSTGHYEMPLSGTPPYMVKAFAKRDFAIASVLLSPRAILPVTMPDGRRAVKLDFKLKKGVRFTGRVVDEDKNPIPQVEITFHLPTENTTEWAGDCDSLRSMTSAEGRFSVPIGTLRTFTMALHKAGYTTVEYTIEPPMEEKDWLLARLGGRIAGRVLTTEGNPLPGNSVRAYSSKPANYGNFDPVSVETKTDAKGEFVFQPMAAGAWWLVAREESPNRFALPISAQQEVTVGELESVEGIELRMPGELIIRGIVVTGPDETPVKGAEIRLGKGHEGPIAPVITGADGRFELNTLFATREQWWGIRQGIEVAKEGFRPGKLEESDQAWMHDKAVPIEEKAILVPEHTVTISGHVVDHDGAPVRDVVVFSDDFDEERALTDAQGRFTVKALQNSPAHLSAVHADGPKTHHPPIDVKESPMTGVRIVLDQGAALELVVLNPEGKPVEGAQVWAMRRTYAVRYSGGTNSHQGLSDADGRVVFDGFPSTGSTIEPDLIRVSVDAGAQYPDYAEVEVRDIKLAPGSTTRQELRMPAKGTATIDGFVRDDAGNAIEGAVVQVQGTSGSVAKSDSLGFFQVEHLLPGKYYVRTDHPKHRTASNYFEAPVSDVVITMGKRE